VLFRSPGVFQSYYKDPEATAETKTSDGWVRSGDAGFFDDNGHLKIIDRAKDVGKLNDGSLFAPKYVENKLKFYPNIKEAVAYGHERDFVTAFINIDLTAVGNWAERNNVAYGSYQELAAEPAGLRDDRARGRGEPRSPPTRSCGRRSSASWSCTRNSTPTTAS
jgi:long-chain acyl-CoA synthetase